MPALRPLLCLVVLALSAAAQQPLIRVDVREVRVPVFVTDAKGHNVAGLKASDFTLQEDGTPQKITAFTTSTDPNGTALLRGEAPGSAAGTRHTYVVCIDTLHLDPANAASLHAALKRLFEKEKPSDAQFSVILLGRRLQVLQTATADPAVAAARIAKAAIQSADAGAVELRSELQSLKTSMYDFCRRCPACGANTSGRTCDPEVQTLLAGLDAKAAPWAMRTRLMLDQLKLVVEELAKLPGARTVVFASDGFTLHPAREFYAVAGSFLPADERFKMPGSADLEPNLQAVIRAAVNANVRIQSVDSRGVISTPAAANGSLDASNPSDWSPPSVIRHTPAANRGGTLLTDMDREASSIAVETGAGMEQLATATGGVWYHGSNDTYQQLRTALADGREFYLLGYVSTNPAQDGKFRAITVEVHNPKLRVRARSGYWAEPSGRR